MPIYEFQCGACGSRFEQLSALGTATATCRQCGADGADRVLSAQAPGLKLVKSRGAARKQERANAKLRQRSKADFKAKRRHAREQAGPGPAGG